jgi:hypothetical protein
MAHGRNGEIASAFRSRNRSRFDNCCGRDENSGSSLLLSRLAAGCNSGSDQLLQHSHTPSLRAARFEDSLSAVAFALCSRSASQAGRAPQPERRRRRKEDDEDENEAFCDIIDQTK